MTRLTPSPLMAAGLFILWLLVNQTLSVGHILLGGAAAVLGVGALTALQPPKARIGRLAAVLRLSGLVLADVVRSNLAVARIVLSPGTRERRSGFVIIPLELSDSYGLATLACIITSTPGTLWVSFEAATGELTIHVLDLVDEANWIDTIKNRYERLLLEIFR